LTIGSYLLILASSSSDIPIVSKTAPDDVMKPAIDAYHKENNKDTTVISWTNLSSKRFTIKFPINSYSFAEARINRSSFSATNDIWNRVYGNLVWHDNKLMGDVFTAYETLRVENSLDTLEFLEAIVTSVQSIPYTYISEGSWDS